MSVVTFPAYDRETEQKTFNPRTRLIELDASRLYLPVAGRVEWFRNEHSDGRIVTTLDIDKEKQTAVATARIFLRIDNRLVCTSTGTACKTVTDEAGITDEIGKNYIECAETAAVGRALAYAGYSTQAAIGSADVKTILDAIHGNSQPQPPHEPVTDAPINAANTGQRLPTTIAEAMAYPCSVKDYAGMTLGHMMQHQKAAFKWLVDMSNADRLDDKKLQAVVLKLEKECNRQLQEKQKLQAQQQAS